MLEGQTKSLFCCGSHGHLKAQCPHRHEKCFICGKKGHLKNTCRRLTQKIKEEKSCVVQSDPDIWKLAGRMIKILSQLIRTTMVDMLGVNDDKLKHLENEFVKLNESVGKIMKLDIYKLICAWKELESK